MSLSTETVSILRIAGMLHFLQLPATALLLPKIILWPDLQRLGPLHRRIVRVLAGSVTLSVLGTGLVVVIGAPVLAEGGLLAGALCLYLGLWWAYRMAAQLYYASVWPRTPSGGISHVALCLLFALKAGLYFAAVALMPW